MRLEGWETEVLNITRLPQQLRQSNESIPGRRLAKAFVTLENSRVKKTEQKLLRTSLLSRVDIRKAGKHYQLPETENIHTWKINKFVVFPVITGFLLLL